MARKKPWWKKLKPGNILGGIISNVVPGGSAFVHSVEKGIDAVKGAGREIAAEAKARGIPIYQAAAEEADRASTAVTTNTQVKKYGPVILIGGGALLLFLLMRRR